jgi:hypothetical protein
MPTRSPAHHNHDLQPALAGTAPSVSADWNPWQTQLLSGSSVLPEQFFSSQASLFTGRPVAALLRAVLEDALACFHRQFRTEGRRAQQEAQEAATWFLSPEEDWPFSFLAVCAVLGLEPEAIRQQLKRWRHSHLAAPQRKIRHVAVRPPHRGIGSRC